MKIKRKVLSLALTMAVLSGIMGVNAGASMNWYSGSNRVAFRNTSPIRVSAQNLGTVSPGFNFSARVAESCTQWRAALGVNVASGQTASSAHIRAYGGSRAVIERAVGEYNTTYAGTNINPIPHVTIGNISTTDGVKSVRRYDTVSEMYVVQLRTESSWHSHYINLTRQTTTHELGHTLGYVGHTTNDQDVMYGGNQPQFTLRNNEKRHLSQIYDRFR